MIEGALSKAPFNSTRNAIVLSTTNRGKYRIRIDGLEYDLPVYGVADLKTGDIVKVVIPCNNMNKAWILPKGGVPENPTFESITIKGHTDPIGHRNSSYVNNVSIPAGVKTVAHTSIEPLQAGSYMVQYEIDSHVLASDVNLSIGFCSPSGFMDNVSKFSYKSGETIQLSECRLYNNTYIRNVSVAVTSDVDIELSRVCIYFTRIY